MKKIEKTLVLSFLFFICLSKLAFAQSAVITVDSSKVIGANSLLLGAMIDQDWKEWNNSFDLRKLAGDANLKLIRMFDWRAGGKSLDPCIFWNETTKTGTFDWTNVDTVVRGIYGIGAEPLFNLGYANSSGSATYVPSGMAINQTTGLPYPESFAAYCGEWAKHFKEIGIPVRYYEIYNEPGHYYGWGGSNLTRVKYFTDVYNACYLKIHQINSNVLVSSDNVNFKKVFDNFMENATGLDFISMIHTYCSATTTDSDSIILQKAEQLNYQSDNAFYTVSEAREKWYSVHNVKLPVLISETSLSWAYETGTDPRIQQMLGAVAHALQIRMAIKNNLSYLLYYRFSSSKTKGQTSETGGFGFGLVNSDDNKPWYPYHVQKLIGNNIAVGDSIVDSSSSYDNIRSLAWINNGKLKILIIHKSTGTTTFRLQGVSGRLSYSKIDDPTGSSYLNPTVQTGIINAADDIILNGYTFMLLQFEVATRYNIFGRLKNKTNYALQADITLYQQGTDNTVATVRTDANGNYLLSANQDIYDLKYSLLNFFIPGFWIKLLAINATSDLNDSVNYVTGYPSENKVYFTADTTGEQTTQIYSPQKPKRVLINGMEIKDVSSLAELKNNTWFYDFTGKRMYIKTSTVSLLLKHFTGSKYFKDMSSETIASLFDMSQASSKDEEKIRQVKQLKPDFKPLLYRSIREISSARTDEWQIAVDNNWLLKDKNGQYVNCTIWPKNFMVDIGNPDYQAWVANWIKEHMDLYGYDGVFADCSFHATASEEWFALSAKPINPRTGNYWTDEEVRQANIQQFKAIRNAIGSKLIVANGLYQGTRFVQRGNEYLEVLSNSPIDGINNEGMWYEYEGNWMTEQEWLNSLNMLVWFQDNFLKADFNRVLVPMCKMERMDGVQYPFPPDSTKEQMAKYAFASTLLGIKTNQNYLCLNANVSFTTQVVQPLFKIDVGSALNDYFMIEDTHVYTRDFSKAKVLVNPTDYSYSVTLGGSYRTLNGETVTAITMNPHTGEILLKM